MSPECAHADRVGEGWSCPLRTVCVRGGVPQQASGAPSGPSTRVWCPATRGGEGPGRLSVSPPAPSARAAPSPLLPEENASGPWERGRLALSRACWVQASSPGPQPDRVALLGAQPAVTAQGSGVVNAGGAPEPPPIPPPQRLRPAPRCLVSLVKFPFSLLTDPARFIFP